jgi:hypothetical protein
MACQRNRTKMVGTALLCATGTAVRVARAFANPTREFLPHVTLSGNVSSSKIVTTGGSPARPSSCHRPTTRS